MQSDSDIKSRYVEFTEFYKKIGEVQFSLLTNQEAVDVASTPITKSYLYDPANHKPLQFGPLDPRLGVSTKDGECQTCFQRYEKCPGHYGFLKLALPIYHLGYFKAALNTLQIICKSCSRVMLKEEERQKYLRIMKRKNMDRLKKVAVLKKIIAECKKMKNCIHCGAYNGTVKKMPGRACKIIHVWSKKGDDEDLRYSEEVEKALSKNKEMEEAFGKRKIDEISPLQAYQLFSKTHDEEIYLLGLDPKLLKPTDLLVTHLIIPPACIRPTVKVGPGETNENDLTVKISEMATVNLGILKSIADGADLNLIYQEWYTLQAIHAQYINAETPGIPKELMGKNPSKTLSQRLKGKQGRFRGNLSGKRVNFSGRTVISPDPNIRIDQVIVPQHMAKNLTYPERVNRYNIQKLKKLVLNGPDKYPGANYIMFANDKGRVDLSYGQRKDRAEHLKIGDVVERHLLDDDVVLFNRQPSLHRLSIMAHRAKVLPWKTLRFNECVCTPYNADFDGDEMNIHLPQTEEARVEALYLMGVHNNLLTPKNGEPIIALTQDFLTCAYLISQRGRFFDRAQFTQICTYLGDGLEHIDLPPPTIMKPVELWTGKQVINAILCPNQKNRILVNVNMKEKNYTKDEFACPKDGWVLFYNSELMTGTLGKSILGSGTKGGLFYSIIKDNSPEQAAKCMNKFAKLSSRWLTNYGMTFGVSDVAPSKELIDSNEERVQKAYKECDDKIKEYKLGSIALMAGCTAEETLENQLNGILSRVRDKVGDICREKLPAYNPPLIMAASGSKGSNINLCQMIACVGQQIVSGHRIPDAFTNRTLPHFEQHSRQPAAKGFVKNSFFTGLTGPEFFFHTMSGREGLIDTAVKTADTGYMQRRLMKALEDLKVNYDYSVRTSDGQVVQFTYGDDAMDPMMMEDGQKPINFERLMKFVKGIHPYKRNAEKTLYPFEILAILEKKKTAEKISDEVVSARFKEDLISYVENYVNSIVQLRIKNDLPPMKDQSELATHIVDEESIKQQIVDNIIHLTKRQCDSFFEKVWERYSKAMIIPSEAVGTVTAQSIGEPGTQMTLKTFHFAGVASMNVTMGVPRIKEIINATKDISTPIINATLYSNKDPITARMVKACIERTTLGDICKQIEEVYAEDGCYLQFVLDPETIQSLKIDVSINQIRDAILKTPRIKLKEQHVKVITPTELVVDSYDSTPENFYFVLQQLKTKLPSIVVTGIPSINRAVINKTDEKDGTSKYNVFAEGYGLKQVMNIPGVDGTKTKTNHIMETEKVLGVEAARRTIDEEIREILRNYSMTVDMRHIGMLADIMTFTGAVLGITRFGITKMKMSTITLASFEKTTDILYDASLACKKEQVNSVSDCIIFGSNMNIGTGSFKLLYDNQKEEVRKQKKNKNLAFLMSDCKLETIAEEL